MSWIDIDKWQEISNSIWRHKLRTALTAFGVGWGIFILVLMLGAIDGLKTSFEHQFADDNLNSIWIWGGETSKPYNGLKEGRNIDFTNADYDYINTQVNDLEASTGRFYLSGTTVTKYKNTALSFRNRAVHPGHLILENNAMIEGRYINDADIRELRKVAVIGREVKKALMPDLPSAVGEEIALDGTVFTVVGVFSDSGGENEEKQVYIPISTAQRIYSAGDRIDQMMFAGGDRNIDEMAMLESQLKGILSKRKQFDPDDNRAVWINNRAEDFEEFNSLFRTFGVVTWIIGIFSIIAGVIGVSNIMLIIVKDRTKEIGIRKALGATPSSIVGMILQESILITGIAGYLGMGIGVAIIALVQDVEADYFRHPTVDLGVVAGATLILVIAGALAGLLPAIKAANINPVIAMKSD